MGAVQVRKPEIVAEIGAEHQQSYQKAVALIYASAQAGADTIKVQMYRPEDMTCDRDDVIREGRWKGYNLYELYEKACMPFEWVPKLRDLACGLGKGFIVSVYSPETVDIAEDLGIGRYKISSFEAEYDDLLEAVAQTGKSVVVSTGVAPYKQIKKISEMFDDVTLLRCVSNYPASPKDMNLKTMTAYEHCFKVKVGVSDHTNGFVVPVVAAVLGADMIEKHITLDGEGLDSEFAILPHVFNGMVQAVRMAVDSVGEVVYGGEKTFHRKLVNGKMIRTAC